MGVDFMSAGEACDANIGEYIHTVLSYPACLTDFEVFRDHLMSQVLLH
jgi:hypothetical protein